jgi:hypothetical protein
MPFCKPLVMGFFEDLLRRKGTFTMQSSDARMWQRARSSGFAPKCECLDPQYSKASFGELRLHAEVQDTNCEGWQRFEKLIETAVSRGNQEFAPGLEMAPELWSQIITLPSSISKLISVRKLYLYNSHLVRMPPEIGDMTSLEELDLYTSYRLHWLPFEVTRCPRLTRSRFSTRALYGNYKYRPPFPRLDERASTAGLVADQCSVCRQACDPESARQVWLSLRVATDVLPLLVNACSSDCLRRLPPPAYGYVDHPHTGGLGLEQPPAGIIPAPPGRGAGSGVGK